MNDLTLTDYLGVDVQQLLRIPPFSRWELHRSTEEDLPTKEIRYVFDGHGVELICDESDRVRTIFLQRGDGEALSEIPFSLSRREVIERYGPPSKSGSAGHVPVLGEHGAWDRFALPATAVHVQYRLDRDQIEMVTLMRPDAVP